MAGPREETLEGTLLSCQAASARSWRARRWIWWRWAQAPHRGCFSACSDLFSCKKTLAKKQWTHLSSKTSRNHPSWWWVNYRTRIFDCILFISRTVLLGGGWFPPCRHITEHSVLSHNKSENCVAWGIWKTIKQIVSNSSSDQFLCQHSILLIRAILVMWLYTVSGYQFRNFDPSGEWIREHTVNSGNVLLNQSRPMDSTWDTSSGSDSI